MNDNQVHPIVGTTGVAFGEKVRPMLGRQFLNEKFKKERKKRKKNFD